MDYFNWFLAPYLHNDKLTFKQAKQILQGFVHQLNQSNRLGAQSAFTNIGLRLKCPSYLIKDIEDVPVVWNGKKFKDSYANYEESARTIYRALMEVVLDGDGKGAPFTFPIITTAITKDLDWNDPAWELSLRAAAEKGTPYFFNLTTPYLDEKYVHAMCCRLLTKHSGGVWNAGGLGAGSNKIVTLNLPHLAALAEENEDRFLGLVREEMVIARQALLDGNKIIKKSRDVWGLLPLLKKPYYDFKKRKLTFGLIGMNEALINLIGEGIVSEEGQKFARKVIEQISKDIERFSKEDEVEYALEQTPAESANFYLASKDKEKFGKRAKVNGRGEKIYYSNSTHVPYNQEIDLMDKVKIEGQFHPYFNGGVISHIWTGESNPSDASMKNLVKKLASSQLGYFTFSPDFTICENSHTSKGKLACCPKCNSKKVDHMSRVVGFFTRTSGWNPGKQQEYAERKRFSVQ